MPTADATRDAAHDATRDAVRDTTRDAARVTMLQTIDTPYGRLDLDPTGLRLGELLVTDEGAELEVVGLDPLRFELAPEEDEDWGE